MFQTIMDVDGLSSGTWLGRKRPVPWSLSKKNISYEVFDFNITSYFTVNNFVIDVGRRKKMLQTIIFQV